MPKSCADCTILKNMGCRIANESGWLTNRRDERCFLKSDEPRVLTLDGVCGGGECWIEYKYGGCGYADVYLSDHLDGTAQVYRCHNSPETVWLNDYGKYWRGWTYCPTEEQRKAVKWDE